MKHLLLILVLLYSLSLTAQVSDSLKYKSLDPYYFHLNYLKEDKAVLIDVWEFFEYKKSRIRDAVNIPSSRKTEQIADTISKDYHIFLYCTTDYRSKRAARMLVEKGFLNVANLDGGMSAWKKDGFPLDKKRIRKSSKK